MKVSKIENSVSICERLKKFQVIPSLESKDGTNEEGLLYTVRWDEYAEDEEEEMEGFEAEDLKAPGHVYPDAAGEDSEPEGVTADSPGASAAAGAAFALGARVLAKLEFEDEPEDWFAATISNVRCWLTYQMIQQSVCLG